MGIFNNIIIENKIESKKKKKKKNAGVYLLLKL